MNLGMDNPICFMPIYKLRLLNIRLGGIYPLPKSQKIKFIIVKQHLTRCCGHANIRFSGSKNRIYSPKPRMSAGYSFFIYGCTRLAAAHGASSYGEKGAENK